MLDRLRVSSFKSLQDVDVEIPHLAVLFGPNASGKSNLLDAIQALSRIGTQRTLADALNDPIRGYPIEAFRFPEGGLAELLVRPSAEFELGADLDRGQNTFAIASKSGSPLTRELSRSPTSI
jgi:AAA15 family ATPase/GTPase